MRRICVLSKKIRYAFLHGERGHGRTVTLVPASGMLPCIKEPVVPLTNVSSLQPRVHPPIVAGIGFEGGRDRDNVTLSSDKPLGYNDELRRI